MIIILQHVSLARSSQPPHLLASPETELPLTYVKGCVTLFPMIKSFTDKHTQDLFVVGISKRVPPDLIKRAIRRLEYIDLATRLDDLKVPPGNRLHALSGDRSGQHAISINNQWRILFRFIDGDAYDVEITDYH